MLLFIYYSYQQDFLPYQQEIQAYQYKIHHLNQPPSSREKTALDQWMVDQNACLKRLQIHYNPDAAGYDLICITSWDCLIKKLNYHTPNTLTITPISYQYRPQLLCHLTIPTQETP